MHLTTRQTALLTVAAILAFSLITVPVAIQPAQAATTRNVTLYAHYAGSIGTLNNIATGGKILNVTSSWSGSVKEVSGTGDVTAKWYLNPVLAGQLDPNGNATVVVYVKASASVTNATIASTLSKVASGGTVTQLATKSASSQTVGTSYTEISQTLPSYSTVVASGFSLELKVVAGAGSSITTTIGYDVTTQKTRVTIPVDDHFTISLAENKDTVMGIDSVTFTVTATDDFGGIDLQTPTITIKDSSDNVRVNGASMTASSVADGQYSNTWTYTYTPKNDVGSGFQGIWDAYASISDTAASSLTSSTLTFTYKALGGGTYQPSAQTTPTAQPTLKVAGADVQTALKDNIWIVVLIIIVVAVAVWLKTREEQ